MRKNEYVVSDERLITPSGLSLVGQVLGKSNLIKKIADLTAVLRSFLGGFVMDKWQSWEERH